MARLVASLAFFSMEGKRKYPRSSIRNIRIYTAALSPLKLLRTKFLSFPFSRLHSLTRFIAPSLKAGLVDISVV